MSYYYSQHFRLFAVSEFEMIHLDYPPQMTRDLALEECRKTQTEQQKAVYGEVPLSPGGIPDGTPAGRWTWKRE